MPYITEDRRADIDVGVSPETVGDLTYMLQQVIQGYLLERGLSYARCAEVLGALEGAKLDFIDRVVLSYEHKKRIENGDVWSPSLTHHPTHL